MAGTKDMSDFFVGKYVVVRSNADGVWMGKCVFHKRGDQFSHVMLAEAYNIHAFSNTAGTAGLAFRGPGKGSRVAYGGDYHECSDVCGIGVASKAARERLRGMDLWDFNDDE